MRRLYLAQAWHMWLVLLLIGELTPEVASTQMGYNVFNPSELAKNILDFKGAPHQQITENAFHKSVCSHFACSEATLSFAGMDTDGGMRPEESTSALSEKVEKGAGTSVSAPTLMTGVLFNDMPNKHYSAYDVLQPGSSTKYPTVVQRMMKCAKCSLRNFFDCCMNWRINNEEQPWHSSPVSLVQGTGVEEIRCLSGRHLKGAHYRAQENARSTRNRIMKQALLWMRSALLAAASGSYLNEGLVNVALQDPNIPDLPPNEDLVCNRGTVWVKNYLASTPLSLVGHILHMLQDSYSGSHSERTILNDSRGALSCRYMNIRRFYSVDVQSPQRHYKFDNKCCDEPREACAIEASKDVLNIGIPAISEMGRLRRENEKGREKESLRRDVDWREPVIAKATDRLLYTMCSDILPMEPEDLEMPAGGAPCEVTGNGWTLFPDKMAYPITNGKPPESTDGRGRVIRQDYTPPEKCRKSGHAFRGDDEWALYEFPEDMWFVQGANKAAIHEDMCGTGVTAETFDEWLESLQNRLESLGISRTYSSSFQVVLSLQRVIEIYRETDRIRRGERDDVLFPERIDLPREDQASGSADSVEVAEYGQEERTALELRDEEGAREEADGDGEGPNISLPSPVGL